MTPRSVGAPGGSCLVLTDKSQTCPWAQACPPRLPRREKAEARDGVAEALQYAEERVCERPSSRGFLAYWSAHCHCHSSSPGKPYVDDLSIVSANTAGTGATKHPEVRESTEGIQSAVPPLHVGVAPARDSGGRIQAPCDSQPVGQEEGAPGSKEGQRMERAGSADAQTLATGKNNPQCLKEGSWAQTANSTELS